MNSKLHILVRLLTSACLFVSLAISSNAGQSDTADSIQVKIDKAQARLGTLEDEEQDNQAAWRHALQNRLALLVELQTTSNAQTSLASTPNSDELREQLANQRSELDTLLALELDASSSLRTLDQLSQFENAVSTATLKAAAAQLATDRAANTQANTREELTGLPTRSAEIKQERLELTADDEITKYRTQSIQLEEQVIAARATFLANQLENLGALEPLRAVELAISQRELEVATHRLSNARTRAAELREEQERVAREDAAEEARRAQLANDPVLRFRLRLRSEVATLKADDASQSTQTEQLKARIDEQKVIIADDARDRDALEERLRIRPEGAESHLRRNRKRSQHELRALEEIELPFALDGIEIVQEELAQVLDRAWELRLPEVENPSLRGFIEEMGPDRKEEAIELFPKLLREEDLLATLSQRQRGLEETDSRYSEITKLIASRQVALEELQSYIASEMMWSHSDPVISGRTIEEAWEEIGTVSSVLTGDKLWTRIGETARDLGGVFLALMAALFGLQTWLRRLRKGDDERASLGPSLSLVMWVRVLVYAAIPSLAIWVLIGAFELNDEALHENRPLAVFANLQAVLILVRRVSRALLGPKGLAIGKWGALPDVGAQWNQTIRIATWAGQSLYAPWVMTTMAPFSAVSLPRLLWFPYVAVMGVAVLRLFRRKGAVMQHWTAPSSLSRLVVQVLGGVGTVMLVPILVMEFLGYRIGANQYALNGLRVFEALFVLMGIYRVLDRTGDALVKRILRNQTGEDEDEQQQATLKAGKALTQMASTLLIVLAAVLFQQAWGIGEPTQRLLESLELVKLEDGSWITGWAIFLGLTWIVGGHILVHNLSRVHDRVFVPFIGSGEIGARYAVLTLIRYATLCLAYFAGLRAFGLDMGTLGWLMTGASVGLGFGLQEVVANFISGLILLFEQPIRVGDIITVGTTGGKIDKITIRATVVTNWERQTIIIPNKNFITQNLINWTRHDQVMRRTLQVRIAYGSDMEKVLQIVDRILVEHPQVLEDPPHRIWVQKLGEFGIELDVWFFASISDGLAARSDISAAILSRFKAEEIEIPIITRDVQAKE